MKKKHIVITLLAVGIVLILLSVVLSVASVANKNIIGGADWHTFRYVFFSENRGLFSVLAFCGVVSIVASIVMGLQKKKALNYTHTMHQVP